jgi:hypothetical protein
MAVKREGNRDWTFYKTTLMWKDATGNTMFFHQRLWSVLYCSFSSGFRFALEKEREAKIHDKSTNILYSENKNTKRNDKKGKITQGLYKLSTIP